MRVRQSAHTWPDGLGVLGKQHRVEGVVFGELPGRFGEVAHLAGIGHNDRKVQLGQRDHQRLLVPAGRFDDHQVRAEFSETLCQTQNAVRVVRFGVNFAGRSDGEIQTVLADVHADKRF